MHGSHRAQITALVEQLGIHLGRRLIGKARLVQLLEHRLTFGIAESTSTASSAGLRKLHFALDASVKRRSREVHCRTGSLQRDQRITRNDQRTHGLSVGCAAANSSCAFFCSSISFSAINSWRSSLLLSRSSS